MNEYCHMLRRNNLNAETVARELGEPELLETLRPAWSAAMEQFPGQTAPSFLDPEEFLTSRAWCGFGAEHDAALRDAAERIRNNPVLCRLAWFYVWKIYDAPQALQANCNDHWPKLAQALGDQAGFFYLLLGLAMVPRLRRFHRMLGVPETVTRETSQQVKCFCGNYQQAHGGRIGIFTRQAPWLRNYCSGNLYFRIGRLEYWSKTFEDPITVFRHRQSGHVLALANNGLCFNEQGFRDEPGKCPAGVRPWTATLRLEEDAARGFPISPFGTAEQREIRLPFAEWQRALGPADPVLEIHIPAGGDMSPEKCKDSLTRAYDFFKSYFPHRLPIGFRCCSWIISPCVEQCLPAKSNLAQFLKETYLFPVASTDPDIWFIFFQEKFDPATAPRDTSLQRAILDYLNAGHTWRNGGMFFLADDLPAFGSQYYRAKWPCYETVAS
jgi:hypothetical protein